MSNFDIAEIVGGQGDKPIVTNAAYAGADIFNILGLSTHDWADNDGRVTSFGLTRDGDTTAFSDAVGDRLYWSLNGLTNVQSGNAPFMGWVTRYHATDGAILVNPDQPETDPIWGAVSNSITTLANGALQKSGGTMSGDIVMSGDSDISFSGDCDITGDNLRVGTSGLPLKEVNSETGRFDRVEMGMNEFIRWTTDSTNYVEFGATSSTQMLMRFVVDGVTSNTYFNLVSE
jgi:hypothetical protein